MKTPEVDWTARSKELAQLLSRSALGDRSAFRRAYELSSGHLFAVILRIQRDRNLAEDLLQEVYVNAWKAAGSFDAQRAQPLTWLTHIARNKAIDSLRRAQAQPRLESLHNSDDDDDRPDAAERMADDAPGPVALLERASDARELGHCMEGLSAQQRQSVALAFFDGLSHAEVADQLRQPLGTVKSWVRRALSTLKTCLERAAQRDGAVGPEMDYANKTLADALAAQYVAGTLRGAARRRFDALLPGHPALRAAVADWQARLMPLTAVLAEEAPPANTWARIEQRLWPVSAAAVAAAPAAVSWWRGLALWRGVSGVATVAALALAVLLARPDAAQPPVLVVLQPTGTDPAAAGSVVASFSADGRAAVARTVMPVAIQSDRALELWWAPLEGKPKSLGLIGADGSTVLRPGALPGGLKGSGIDHMAVSVEPAGGSPTGQPTGPVLFYGKLTP